MPLKSYLLIFTNYVRFLFYNFIFNVSDNTFDASFRCMVYGNPFYISVVTPVAIIMLANIMILIKVTITLHRSNNGKNLHKSNNDKTMTVIKESRIAFGLNLLLGTTWILAFLAVEEVTMTFQWLFCIINSLQGFFIFVFYTARVSDVRNAWVEALQSLLKMFRNSISEDQTGKNLYFNSLLILRISSLYYIIFESIILLCFLVF